MIYTFVLEDYNGRLLQSDLRFSDKSPIDISVIQHKIDDPYKSLVTENGYVIVNESGKLKTIKKEESNFNKGSTFKIVNRGKTFQIKDQSGQCLVSLDEKLSVGSCDKSRSKFRQSDHKTRQQSDNLENSTDDLSLFKNKHKFQSDLSDNHKSKGDVNDDEYIKKSDIKMLRDVLVKAAEIESRLVKEQKKNDEDITSNESEIENKTSAEFADHVKSKSDLGNEGENKADLEEYLGEILKRKKPKLGRDRSMYNPERFVFAQNRAAGNIQDSQAYLCNTPESCEMHKKNIMISTATPNLISYDPQKYQYNSNLNMQNLALPHLNYANPSMQQANSLSQNQMTPSSVSNLPSIFYPYSNGSYVDSLNPNNMNVESPVQMSPDNFYNQGFGSNYGSTVPSQQAGVIGELISRQKREKYLIKKSRILKNIYKSILAGQDTSIPMYRLIKLESKYKPYFSSAERLKEAEDIENDILLTSQMINTGIRESKENIKNEIKQEIHNLIMNDKISGLVVDNKIRNRDEINKIRSDNKKSSSGGGGGGGLFGKLAKMTPLGAAASSVLDI